MPEKRCRWSTVGETTDESYKPLLCADDCTDKPTRPRCPRLAQLLRLTLSDDEKRTYFDAQET